MFTAPSLPTNLISRSTISKTLHDFVLFYVTLLIIFSISLWIPPTSTTTKNLRVLCSENTKSLSCFVFINDNNTPPRVWHSKNGRFQTIPYSFNTVPVSNGGCFRKPWDKTNRSNPNWFTMGTPHWLCRYLPHMHCSPFLVYFFSMFGCYTSYLFKEKLTDNLNRDKQTYT